MKEIIFLIAVFNLFIISLSSQTSVHGSVRVSQNNRFLQYEDGTPFFYLGETAWELFHRCSREEASLFLKNRAEKGFTVIQAVILAELDGVHTPNVYEDFPLIYDDPLKPNEAYFQHVDYIIDMAATYGLVIALLPTWGDKVAGDNPMFNIDNAEKFGNFLGTRYKKRKNIIWMLGGDRDWTGYENVWRAMAKGITIGVAGSEDYSKTLITLHSCGGTSSSQWFHNDVWLDFNLQQNGHCYTTSTWDKIYADYNRTPIKPVIDGEPLYEEHPICFNATENGFSTDYHVRRYLYHDLFSGALGHTYGCHAIWQMYTKERTPINFPRRSWLESLNLPGAFEMQYARWLIESRPFFSRIPDQSLILSDAGTLNYRVSATRDTEGSYAFIYSEQGKGFTVDLTKLKAKNIVAWWYNPRNGVASKPDLFDNPGKKDFVPPSNGVGNDWVLVLDDASKKYSIPGFHSISENIPMPVKNIIIADIKPTSVTLQWENPDQISNINGYIVYIDGKEYGGTPFNNITVNNLLPETKYTFSVVKLADNLKESTKGNKVIAKTSKGIKINKLSIKPSTLLLEAGKKEKLNTTISPNNATLRKLKWSSSDTSIAIVNSEGIIFGRIPGDVTITVSSTVDGISVSNLVKVILPVDLLDVKYMKDDIIFDGKLNESCWNNFQIISKAVAGKPNNQASFALAWNDDYLIVAVKVTDDKLVFDSPFSLWNDDGVEIYINSNNSKSNTTSSSDRQFVAVPGKPVLEAKDNTSGVISNLIKNSNGFSGEIAIPFTNLGIKSTDGLLIGFDISNNDDDDGGERDNVLIWKGTVADWTNTSSYGTIRLIK
jgi:hypothetical protein